MWDPRKYLEFSEYRDRPAHDLLVRVGADTARRVVDVGCGSGNLTPLLAARWPEAVIEAIDASSEMVQAARANGIDARLEDVRDWQPAPDTDVALCNAVLQWVPDHVELLRAWLRALPERAWFAFQVPGNFDAPAHRTLRELAGESGWSQRLAGVLREPDCVLAAVDYADAIADLDIEVDAWETTYVHRLRGEDPVLEWLSGTALRPVRSVLGDEQWQRFRTELTPRLRAAYPQRTDGTTWFPFRRIFVVAHRR
ncbi:trans-aconitate 2-methyltransferase [Halopolyspora algeriensis]|uniref:Trans-aconitate 2-methyltransferase n=1 Tax=Halopolyspora algeriensis TaxID=1500506 RepID=A0A368VNT6_9ACTN|nr:trans-aconitate 2-methyltransferase [Halopolyspora algeriensis]RCW40773.1 trans-aconitate 2-methyltransferase [Halopolyspora algeriensis]TQM53308.1 trans-aconitate 2-methyltransferase [Halopolyspora algeriensis]